MENSHPNFEELPRLVEALSQQVMSMSAKLDAFGQQANPTKTDVNMTPDEVAEYFKKDKSTIHRWTEQGKLKKYGISNSVFYKRFEVENALKEIRQDEQLRRTEKRN